VPTPEIEAHFSELVANNTVTGKLVALPHRYRSAVLPHRPVAAPRVPQSPGELGRT
jgi:hypothetical protein